jgi:hypothetical protein
MIDTQLKDGRGAGTYARITNRGELVVGPPAHSTPASQTMDSDNTAVNFFKPKPGKQLIITSIVLVADRQVGVNDATVQIYGATEDNSTTVTQAILNVDIAKNSSLALTGLDWEVNEGLFLNGVSDDSIVGATVAGYYANA